MLPAVRNRHVCAFIMLPAPRGLAFTSQPVAVNLQPALLLGYDSRVARLLHGCMVLTSLALGNTSLAFGTFP